MTDFIPFSRVPELSLDELKDDFKAILKSGVYVNGKYARELEDTVRDFYMSRYCLSFGSGTSALWWAVYAIKQLYMKNYRPVCAIPAFTWSSTFYALAPADYDKVILKDVSPDTWLMESTVGDPDVPDLVMPVTTFGNNFNRNLREFFPDSYIVLDATHNLGSYIPKSDEYDVAVFSLAPTKNIPAADGGLLLTDNISVAAMVAEERDKYGRMTEFSAAIALKNWEKASRLLRQKEEGRKEYVSRLPNFRFQRCYRSAHSVCACLLDRPSQPIVDALAGEIEFKRYYQPIKEGLPTTDDIYNRILCLPNYDGVDREFVAKRIIEELGRKG